MSRLVQFDDSWCSSPQPTLVKSSFVGKIPGYQLFICCFQNKGAHSSLAFTSVPLLLLALIRSTLRG